MQLATSLPLVDTSGNDLHSKATSSIAMPLPGCSPRPRSGLCRSIERPGPFPATQHSSQEPSHLQSSGWDGLSLHPASSSTKVCLHLLFRVGMLRASPNKCLTWSSQSLISRSTSLKQHTQKITWIYILS